MKWKLFVFLTKLAHSTGHLAWDEDIFQGMVRKKDEQYVQQQIEASLSPLGITITKFHPLKLDFLEAHITSEEGQESYEEFVDDGV